MKPEVKLAGNMNDLLQRACAGHSKPDRHLWVAEIGHAGWTIQVAPSRGAEGPPFNMRVVDPAGVERKLCFWIETVEEAIRKAGNTMALAGVAVNRSELAIIARSFDKRPEAT